MKLLTIFLMLSFTAHSQVKVLADAGADQHGKTEISVSAQYGSKLFVSVTGRTHTNLFKYSAYGYLSCGVAAGPVDLYGGYALGGGLVKQDRHVTDTGIIVLSKGAVSDKFGSMVIGSRFNFGKQFYVGADYLVKIKEASFFVGIKF